ncbi:MAG TPA: hypothetical protein VF574_02140 [Allosphingosinicella sp.]
MDTGLEFGKLAVLALLVSGGTYAAWPSTPARTTLTLPQPMPAAVERLQSRERVVEGTGMGSLTLAAAGRDADALLIGITRAGDPKILTCRVAIAPASPATSSAEVDCTQKQVADRPIRRVAARALELVMIEHVAATVEDRAYDIDRVSTRLIALIATEPAAIAGMVQGPRD